MTNRRHNYMIRQAIYQLKRQYGSGPLDIYQASSATVNMVTGMKTNTVTMTRINVVVYLPEKADKTLVQSISKISADKAFVYGGTWDTKTRLFLIDRLDAPSLNLTTDDWLIYRSKKYEVKSFDSFEFDSLWVVKATQVVGDVPNQIIPLRAESFMDFTEEVDDG